MLFFAFVSQLKSLLGKTEYEYDLPKLETVDEPTKDPWALPWLKDDVPWDSIRDYFPAESIKGISVTSPHPVRLSVLLDAFQQLMRKIKDITERNVLLEGRAGMVSDLMARITHLETQLSGYKGDDGFKGQLDEGSKEIESLQRSYYRSEERCKQLVIVTQQWAIECEDKDKVCIV